MDISTHRGQQGQTTNHLCLGIDEPDRELPMADQELPMADQDVPWKLTPWAHTVIIVDSLEIGRASCRERV